jgi:addiction module HigA family antidote
MTISPSSVPATSMTSRSSITIEVTMRRRKLRNVHPGEVLLEEFLKPIGLTRYQLVKRIRGPQTRVAEICRGRRAVTADTALRLARFFGTSSKFWLGLQEDYDIEEGLRAKGADIAAIEPLAS